MMSEKSQVALNICILIYSVLQVSSITVTLPPAVSVNELDSVNVTCSINIASSDDFIIDVRWTRLNDPLFLQTGEELLIDSVKTDDAGVYTCTVYSRANLTAAFASTMLDVLYSPRWNFDYLQKFGAKFGSNIDLICVIKANPRPQFYWTNAAGQNLTLTGHYTVKSQADRSILTITNVVQTDYGEYVCVVSNDGGVARFRLPLLEPGIPDSPKVCDLTSHDSDSAALSCVPGYKGGSDVFYPVYKSTLKSAPEEAKSLVIASSDKFVQIKVSDLLSGTNYTLRVYGANEYGKSNDSLLVYFKTDGTAPPPGSATKKSDLPAIIGGSVGGGVFVIICLVLLIICVRRCKRSKSVSRPFTTTVQAKNTNHYTMDEDGRNLNRTNSWRSSKRKNSRGNGSSIEIGQPIQISNPIQNEERNLSNIQYDNPIVYDNKAYTGDIHWNNPAQNGANTPENNIYATTPSNYNPTRNPEYGYGQNNPVIRANIYSGNNAGSRDDIYSNRNVNAYAGNNVNPYAINPSSYYAGNNARVPERSEYSSKSLPAFNHEIPNSSELYRQNSTNQALSLATDQPILAGFGALSGVKKPKSEIVLSPSLYAQPFKEQKLLNNEPTRNREMELTQDSIYSGLSWDSGSSAQMRDYADNAEANRSRDTVLSVKTVTFQPDVPWEFPREKLYVRHKIGEGALTEVWQAKVDGILGRPGRRVVAVKMLRENFTEQEGRYLEQELSVLQTIQPHPNIIMLLGCCTRSSQFGPLCVIVEFAPNGSLLGLLRRQRIAFSVNNLSQDSPMASRKRHINLSSRDLTLFALHVASAMEYISSKQLLHRDLAARSVLLDDQLVCKVSDFGLATDIAERRQYESKTSRRLPIRWMAPESLLTSEYSVKSDVWSYGILLWEILSLGSTPYTGLSGPQVLEFVQGGGRMDKLKYCPEQLETLMYNCWSRNPIQRPHFLSIKRQLESILDPASQFSHGQVLYVDQMSDNALEILHTQPGEKC